MFGEKASTVARLIEHVDQRVTEADQAARLIKFHPDHGKHGVITENNSLSVAIAPPIRYDVCVWGYTMRRKLDF
jgi:hypothetical protein